MTGYGRWIAGVLAAVAVAITVSQWVRLADAGRSRTASEAGLAAAKSDAAELARLRALMPVRVFREPPDEAFIRAVNSTLEAAGLDPTLAHRIDKDTSRANSNGQSQTKEMRIDLQPMTVGQLGSFLQGWDTEQPAWRVTTIRMSKLTGRQASDQAYRVMLTCSAEYAMTETP